MHQLYPLARVPRVSSPALLLSGLLFTTLSLSACHHHHHNDDEPDSVEPPATALAVTPAPQLSQSGSLSLQSYDDTTNASGEVATSNGKTLYHEGSI